MQRLVKNLTPGGATFRTLSATCYTTLDAPSTKSVNWAWYHRRQLLRQLPIEIWNECNEPAGAGYRRGAMNGTDRFSLELSRRETPKTALLNTAELAS